MATYSYSGTTIQKVTVATTGIYDITAYGAHGGNSVGVSGGAGAEVGGDFTLTKGERLEIVVGGAGGYGQTSLGVGDGGGGGGGSFVLASTDGGASYQLLLAAGGGGGGYHTDGGAASYSAAGSGAGGAGGGGPSGPNGGATKFLTGGGGSGYNSDGVGYSGRAGGGANRTGGYAGGGQASPGLGYTGHGGFGGGGGGNEGGGGGGGYSGGAGGYYVGGGRDTGGGGGGTSIDKGSSPLVAQSAVAENALNMDNGEVLISPTAACYRGGVLILTERGEVAVEHLEIGDRVVTASGCSRPVVWLGHRALDISRHPAPLDLWPVRVATGAFGKNLPRRDLWLSPGHNIAAEGVIMPICALINGHSVAQIKQDRVEYWHVELDAHDIIFAEGLPAESYLDCGNRADFVNGGAYIEAHPDLRPRQWAETCLPLVKDGPEVAATRARLLTLLREQGFTLTRDAEAHVLADGQRLQPVQISRKGLIFAVPEGAKNITLRSNVFVPARTFADSPDSRTLGLCVGRLEIDGSEIALDGAELSSAGWHEAEYENGALARRWTSGVVSLPAGARNVVVDLAGRGHYWCAPMESVVAGLPEAQARQCA